VKRKGNLFNSIINTNNILLAHKRARKGKISYKDVRYVDDNLNQVVFNINQSLINKTFTTSDYQIEKRTERGKERVIYKLPYAKDRIIHHSLLQVIQPILEKTYIKDTYQSIKGRGIHKAKDRVKLFMKNKENTKYCLKMDIKKFYPSVDNNILKSLIRKKVKCEDTLWLIDDIIDSTKGLPIGNYTSQTFGNYYLSFFDHFIKEELDVKYYIRYADDMVFFSSSKKELHIIRMKVEKYLNEKLNLQLKHDWQIFETRKRGLDFLGFRFFDKYTLLRKSIAIEFKRVCIKANKLTLDILNSLMSYYGWIKASDSYNLLRKSLDIDILKKINNLSKMLKRKSPARLLATKPKKNINIFGNYQPALF
jgi:RNA-directed DNA polymerase